ncbi:MAG: hypothetical protein PBV01_09330 [Brucella anthropi]
MSLTEKQIDQRDIVRAWGVELLPKILSNSIEALIGVHVFDTAIDQPIRNDGKKIQISDDEYIIHYGAIYANIFRQPIKFEKSKEDFSEKLSLYFARNNYFFMEINQPEPGKFLMDYHEFQNQPIDKLSFHLLPDEISIHALRDKNEALQLRLTYGHYLKPFDPTEIVL